MVQPQMLRLIWLVGSFFCLTLGMKTSWSTTSKGTYTSLIVKAFGMTSAGTINVQYTVEAVNTSTYVVLVAVNEDQREGWYTSVGQSSQVNSICSQPSSYRAILGVGSGNFTWTPKNSNQYSIIAMQCRPSINEVTLSINVDMKNVLSDGSTGYMSIEDVNYLRLYQGELIVYALLIAGLLGQYYFRRYLYVFSNDFC